MEAKAPYQGTLIPKARASLSSRLVFASLLSSSCITFDNELAQDDEIGDLTRSFSTMVEKLRDEQSQKKKK